jgi:cell division protein FtsI/penicillin-binding protein 2
MSNETIDVVKARKYFYRDNFRRLSNVLMVVLVIILFLILAIVYIALTRSEKYYYATSYISELTVLKPVKRGTGLPNPEKDPIDQKSVTETNPAR